MSDDQQQPLTPKELYQRHRASLNRFSYRRQAPAEQPDEQTTNIQGGEQGAPLITPAEAYRRHRQGNFNTAAGDGTKGIWKRG